MKFDTFKYNEVPTNEEFEIEKGWLRLRASRPCALFITSEGFEALAGYGTEWALDLSEGGTARLEAADGIRAFIEAPIPTSVARADEEVFTNADRMPMESGSVAEVTAALRMFKMQQQRILSQVRQEAAALQRARVVAPAVPLENALPDDLAALQAPPDGAAQA